MILTDIPVPTTVAEAHVWSTEEKRILVQAARCAPRRWLGDEWALEIRADEVELFERLHETRWLRDRGGRARDRVATIRAVPFDAPALRGSLAGVAGVPGTPQLVVIVHQRGNTETKGKTS